jgi:C4-dicarboxylate transporter DctM subunit
MSETYKGVLPFVATDIVRMLVLMFFPALTLSVVNFFFK